MVVVMIKLRVSQDKGELQNCNTGKTCGGFKS